MKSVISKDIDLGNGKRLNVYVGDDTTPSPYAVAYYAKDYEQGPDSELPAAFTEGLVKLIKDEVVQPDNEDALFGEHGVLHIAVAALPGQRDVRVAVTKEYAVKVEQFVMISCPGQPGWYEAPGYYRTTALALALVAMAKLVEARKNRSV